MAKVIEGKFGITPQLLKGGGGAFEIAVDGKMIFSKKQTGRFPEHDEILLTLGGLAS